MINKLYKGTNILRGEISIMLANTFNLIIIVEVIMKL